MYVIGLMWSTFDNPYPRGPTQHIMFPDQKASVFSFCLPLSSAQVCSATRTTRTASLTTSKAAAAEEFHGPLCRAALQFELGAMPVSHKPQTMRQMLQRAVLQNDPVQTKISILHFSNNNKPSRRKSIRIPFALWFLIRMQCCVLDRC